ncbi:hypothetical protein ACH5RR_040530 [Cinchona calisaya]|uniref:Uncharacterized protein n=1 Tax=Cinchona calisaya TaxID=153742 RepID=A0ABD2XSV7_9GENT
MVRVENDDFLAARTIGHGGSRTEGPAGHDTPRMGTQQGVMLLGRGPSCKRSYQSWSKKEVEWRKLDWRQTGAKDFTPILIVARALANVACTTMGPSPSACIAGDPS